MRVEVLPRNLVRFDSDSIEHAKYKKADYANGQFRHEPMVSSNLKSVYSLRNSKAYNASQKQKENTG